MKCKNPTLIYYYAFVFVLFLVCLYICVCECLLQINLAGVPSNQAALGFPKYCALG